MISTPSTGATLVVVTFEAEVLLLVLFGGSEVVTFSAVLVVGSCGTVVFSSGGVAFSSVIVGSCGTVVFY
jgi:preprotein translocase subunit SecF